jgi:hypothetical protein
MNIHENLQQVPESAKIIVATGSSALTLLGIPVEQWMYILSGIVSILFIIEKFPIFVERMKQLKRWIKNEDSSSCE